jgi:hypothetical protein
VVELLEQEHWYQFRILDSQHHIDEVLFQYKIEYPYYHDDLNAQKHFQCHTNAFLRFMINNVSYSILVLDYHSAYEACNIW